MGSDSYSDRDGDVEDVGVKKVESKVTKTMNHTNGDSGGEDVDATNAHAASDLGRGDSEEGGEEGGEEEGGEEGVAEDAMDVDDDAMGGSDIDAVEAAIREVQLKKNYPHKKSKEQVDLLEALFQEKMYPARTELTEVAMKSKLSFDQVNAWFNNRRQRVIREKCMEIAKKKLAGEEVGDEEEDDVIPKGNREVQDVNPAPKPKVQKDGSDKENDRSDSEATLGADEDEEEAAQKRLIAKLLIWAQDRLPVPYNPAGPPLSYTFDEPIYTGKRKRKSVSTAQMKRNNKKMRVSRMQKKEVAAQARIAREAEKARERLEREMQKAQEKLARKEALLEEKREKEKERLRKLKEKEDARIKDQIMRQRLKTELKIARERDRDERREEQRRQKEAEKARNAEKERQERMLSKAKPNDEDLEIGRLAEKLYSEDCEKKIPVPENGVLLIPSYYELAEDEKKQLGVRAEQLFDATRPEFPAKVEMESIFAKRQGMDPGLRSRILMIWAFINFFSENMGMKKMTLTRYLNAMLRADMCDPDFVDIHLALVKCVVADMDEAVYATETLKESEVVHAVNKSVWQEGFAWGFDAVSWRAHINVLSWPEVLRQWACAANLGRRRPVVKMGGNVGNGVSSNDFHQPRDMKMPGHFVVGSVKAAVWKVLATAGPAGLRTDEIAVRIMQDGLRANSSAANVAGSISKDPAFMKVAQAKYCLRYYYDKEKKRESHKGEGKEGGGAENHTESGSPGGVADGQIAKSEAQEEAKSEEAKEEAKLEVKEEDMEDVGKTSGDAVEAFEEQPAKEWVIALESKEFNELSLSMRIEALEDVISFCLDGLMVRRAVEDSLEAFQDYKRELVNAAMQERDYLKGVTADFVSMSKVGAEGNGESNGPAAVEEAYKSLDEKVKENFTKSPNGSVEPTQKTYAIMNKPIKDIHLEAGKEATLFHRVREELLGEDRRYNRYWRFLTEKPLAGEGKVKGKEHPSLGRIFVEKRFPPTGPRDNNEYVPDWYVIDRESAFDRLLEELDNMGIREAKLEKALKQDEARIRSAMSNIADKNVAGTTHLTKAEQHVSLRAAQELVLSVKLNSSKISRKSGSFTIDAHGEEKDFRAEDDLRSRFLKCAVKDIECAISNDAVLPNWSMNRRRWLFRVTDAPNFVELRKCLGELEQAILPEWVSDEFRGENRRPPHPEPIVGSEKALLGFVPATCAGVAMRILSFDSAIVYKAGHYTAREICPAYNKIERSSILSCVLNWEDGRSTVLPRSHPRVKVEAARAGEARIKKAVFKRGPGRPRREAPKVTSVSEAPEEVAEEEEEEEEEEMDDDDDDWA